MIAAKGQKTVLFSLLVLVCAILLLSNFCGVSADENVKVAVVDNTENLNIPLSVPLEQIQRAQQFDQHRMENEQGNIRKLNLKDVVRQAVEQLEQ